ncbi:CaiB/BaiF CoA-transferase family protein [Streptomyces sp. SID3212]|uniref:CaiB/BaiF CoA transferase family protein n=1 Tax=unclassified Streptomyces TaxID=2593676 RepID=UPI00136B7CEC|nr:CaiB/BaiF CoA-transferase family protein [Streptomyces sp. SID3212]MYV52287.1 CoA transferase [Streptomyces sp. SID3212]
MTGDLRGIRVIAVEQAVAAPLCTRHLADLGAEVIKIERPGGGDFARGYDESVYGRSTHFVWLNRGKRSVVLDLKSEPGRDALRRLLAGADVLVCNLAPGALNRIITDEALAELNPRLVRCYLSGYGPSGPYADRKAYDALVQGEAGTISATGTPETPAKPGVSLADLAGGTYALSAVTAALYARERTGVGRRIDVALFDVLLEWMSPLLLAELHSGSAPPPAGMRHASIAPYGPYTTADGQDVLIAVQNEGQWQRLCRTVLDHTELLDDPAFGSNSARVRHRERTERAVQARLITLSTAEVTARLEAADVPYARLNQIADVLAHPQAEATGRWSEATLPDGRAVRVVTSPLHRVPEPPGGRRVPALGEHTGEVLRELGLPEAPAPVPVAE